MEMEKERERERVNGKKKSAKTFVRAFPHWRIIIITPEPLTASASKDYNNNIIILTGCYFTGAKVPHEVMGGSPHPTLEDR